MSSCSLRTGSVWGRGRCWSVVLCVRVIWVIMLVRVVLLVLGWEVVELLCVAVGVSGVEWHPAGSVVRLETTTAAAAGYAPESG